MPDEDRNYFDTAIDPATIDKGGGYTGESDGGSNGVAGDGGSGADEYGNATIGESGESGGRKRRSDAGKPRGPRGARRQKNNLDIGGISAFLLGIHFSLATMMKVPEAALSREECDLLAERIAAVEAHFPHVASQKWIDIGALATCTAGIYYAHYQAYMQRIVAEQARDITPTGLQ